MERQRMKNKILTTLLIFTLAFLVFGMSNLYANTSHMVTGKIQYTSTTFPEDLSWTAWISGPDHHTDVIRDNEPEAKYHHDTGIVEFDLKNLNYQWQVGDTMTVKFTDTHMNTLTVNYVLTANSPDNFGTYTMSQTMAKLSIMHYQETWGSIEPKDGDHGYPIGTVVTIKAFPSKGYRFKYWTTNVADPYAATTTVTMNTDQKVDGVFSKLVWTLTMASDPPEGGTTDPPTGVSEHNTAYVIPLKAIPNPGYKFVKWVGNVADSLSDSTSITMLQHEAVTAIFELTEQPKPRYLTINASPANGGSTEPAVGEHEFPSGTLVNISAIPDEGYRFVNWTGDVTEPDSANTTIQMDTTKAITANFERITHTLNINVSPASSGLTIPTIGQYTYPQDTVISITAVPMQGYRFVNWTGVVANPDTAVTTVVMDSSKTITANFELITYNLSISVNPPNTGITIPAPGSYYDLKPDSVVNLSAIPANGYRFLNWTGVVTKKDTAVTTVVMDSSKHVIANFVLVSDIVVTTVPSGLEMVVDGQTYVSPHTFSWGDSSIHTIAIDSTIQYGATGVRYIFANWSDQGALSHQVTAGEMDTYTATFSTQFYLATGVDPVTGGAVVPASPGAWYDDGVKVVVSAAANSDSGYIFSGWGGALAGSANPDTVVMDTTKSITANFTLGDLQSPVLSWIYPVKGAKQVPRNTSVQFKLYDSTTGINPASLQLKVKGQNIITNGVDQTGGHAVMTYKGKGALVKYTPVTPFSANDSVVVRVTCADYSLFTNVLDTTVYFKTGSSQLTPTTLDTLTMAGGVVSDDTTGITITVPQNALTDTTEIGVSIADGYPDLPIGVYGMPLGLYFSPAGLVFADSVTISIPYNQALLDSAHVSSPMDLAIYYYSVTTGNWTKLKIVWADGANIYVKVKSFCYLVFGQNITTLSVPNMPAGQTDLLVDDWYGFETSKVTSSVGHAVEYRYSWGDGTNSSWSPDTSAAHKWSSEGTFGIVAFARSKVDTSQMTYSDTLFVNVHLFNSVENGNAVPQTFALYQNYPNPFNPETSIRYQVPENTHVTLEIYNIQGQKIRHLVNEEKSAGYYTIVWDGKNDSNVGVSSGVYILQMKAGQYQNVIKMSFLK